MRKSYTRILGMLMALAMLLTLLPTAAFAADDPVRIDETTFPDQSFRNYVEKHFDWDQDGWLSSREMNGVESIVVDSMRISSLTGVGYFGRLKHLDCRGNRLTSLDLSNNPKLTELICDSNKLTSLDLGNNPELVYLTCRANQLSKLNISNSPALTELSCSSSTLTTLDVSHNPELRLLYCLQNKLTALDVSHNPKLTLLYCTENKLKTLDVGHNLALTSLECSDNQLSTLDVSHNSELKLLYCARNELTALDVSHNPALIALECNNNQLTALNIGNNPALLSLDCRNNKLTALDASHAPVLDSLACSNNQLTALNVTGNGGLRALYCNNNCLTSLDLRRNNDLNYVECNNNRRDVALTAAQTFDLSTLPNFDVTRASNWQGGTVDGNMLYFQSVNGTVTYDYDCGNGQMATFKLVESMPFTDVKKDSWYENDVRYALKNGLMAGTSDTTFSPQSTTTRGMAVTVLYRLAGNPAASLKNSFSDVAVDRYYAEAVEWAAANHIVSGYGNGKFGPNDSVTREQLASFLYRYASTNDYDTSATADLTRFADSNKISSYAETALRWANGAGLLYGKDNNMLDPKGKATRAEIAAILHRFCDKIAR